MAVSTICFRIALLLSIEVLSLQSDEKSVLLDLNCVEDGSDFNCILSDLSITITDESSKFLISQVEKPPQDLSISSSKIFFIPAIIFEKLSDLRRFAAFEVEIEEIYYATFGAAHNLRTIDLSSNKIKLLVDEVFRNASHLKELKLDRNRIISIGTRAFFKLSELEVLNLSYNQITYLPLFCFKSLKNLKSLELSYNFITVVSLDQFESNSNLQFISFDNNEIATIDEGTFDNLTQLEKLKLRDNICVNLHFIPWNKTHAADLLHCCTKIIFNAKCAQNTKKEAEKQQNSFNTNVVLLIMLSLTTFSVLTIYLIYKKRSGNVAQEDFELITNSFEEQDYLVY